MSKSILPKPAKTDADVLIIGAGIAGLACARELQLAGFKVLIAEGRARVGGRIFTRRHPDWELPAELGSEFIHGAPREILERLATGSIPFVDAADEHLTRVGENLASDDEYFEELRDAMKEISRLRADVSVHDFVETKGKRWPTELRALFRAFVEGFHAADLHQMSTFGLAESEQTDDDALNGVSSFRLPGGYDQLVELVKHSLLGAEDCLLLERTVKEIAWEPGRVTVSLESALGEPTAKLRAKACVVTVPIGVLKAPPEAKAAIRFVPEPPLLAKVKSALHMGHALRIVLRFRTRFWESLSGKLISYLHTGPGRDFPTWWTLAPLRAPMLVAWQGGPRAGELSRLPPEELVRRALESLSFLTRWPVAKLARELRGWDTHDWSGDPYSLGAYSYVHVDGTDAARDFAKPVKGTLFFAGEATFSGSERGTVSGALKSGLRAAKQITRSLSVP